MYYQFWLVSFFPKNPRAGHFSFPWIMSILGNLRRIQVLGMAQWRILILVKQRDSSGNSFLVLLVAEMAADKTRKSNSNVIWAEKNLPLSLWWMFFCLQKESSPCKTCINSHGWGEISVAFSGSSLLICPDWLDFLMIPEHSPDWWSRVAILLQIKL